MPEPTCAFHSERITYVSCTRCGRSICPDCMTQAPVGFHCPACIAEARATVRRVTEFTPRLTFTLVGICVAVAVLGTLGIGTNSGFLQEFAMVPAYIAGYGEYWRLFTAAFVHGGMLHLVMNMLMLWAMGRTLEQVIGRLGLITVFTLSALGGSVASYYFSAPNTASVGASGAIFGMFAAVFMLGREYGRNTQEILGVIVLNLLIGFVVPGIDWRAHAGGLVVGAAVGWAMVPGRPGLIRWSTVVITGSALALVVQLRTAEILALMGVSA